MEKASGTRRSGRRGPSGLAVLLTVGIALVAWLAVPSVTSGNASSSAPAGLAAHTSWIRSDAARAMHGSSLKSGALNPSPISSHVIPAVSSGNYTVSFVASGLPDGAGWVALVNSTPIPELNIQSNTTSGGVGIVTFYEPNGSYAFHVFNGSAWWVASPATGSLIVAGSNVTVGINFTRLPGVRLTLHETGLPGPVSWGVNSPGGLLETNLTTTRTVTVEVPNGTSVRVPLQVPAGYGIYSIRGPAGLAVPSDLVPTYLNDAVNGTASASIVLAPSETVDFQQTGFPLSDQWYLNLSTVAPRATSVHHIYSSGHIILSGLTSFPLLLLKGAYNFTVQTANPHYRVAPSHGVLGVPAHNLTKSIRFVHLTDRVLFRSVGLLPGTNWTVHISGQENLTANSSASTLALHLETGTYAFEITSPNLSIYAGPSNGTFTVNSTRSPVVLYVAWNFVPTAALEPTGSRVSPATSDLALRAIF